MLCYALNNVKPRNNPHSLDLRVTIVTLVDLLFATKYVNFLLSFDNYHLYLHTKDETYNYLLSLGLLLYFPRPQQSFPRGTRVPYKEKVLYDFQGLSYTPQGIAYLA